MAILVVAATAMESHQLPRRPDSPHKPFSFPNALPTRVLKQPRVLKEPKVISKLDTLSTKEEPMPSDSMEERQPKELPEPPVPVSPVPSPTPSAIHGLQPKYPHSYPAPYHPAPVPYHHPAPPHHAPYVPHGPPPPYHAPDHPKVNLFHNMVAKRIYKWPK